MAPRACAYGAAVWRPFGHIARQAANRLAYAHLPRYGAYPHQSPAGRTRQQGIAPPRTFNIPLPQSRRNLAGLLYFIPGSTTCSGSWSFRLAPSAKVVNLASIPDARSGETRGWQPAPPWLHTRHHPSSVLSARSGAADHRQPRPPHRAPSLAKLEAAVGFAPTTSCL